MDKTVLIALGGNAISPKNSAGTIEEQFSHTRESLKAIMHFVHLNYKIGITHGNGPQVGDELRRNEVASSEIPSLPLGVLVANTQGAIGYMIQQSLQNALHHHNIEREVVSFISQVRVDSDDPSLKSPAKFVGRRYPKNKAERFIKELNWDMKEQEPGEWRRVVPSPQPKYLFNGYSIKNLIDFGTIVIASGGGGIPCFFNVDGELEGINGVIDKDMSAALLGRILKAEELFIITDVDNIFINFKQYNQKPLINTTVSEIKHYLSMGHFKRGTMEPKIEAALYFLKYHGHKVVITSINCIKDAIDGIKGTTIRND
ncbi:MAG: carbamate kinase [Candidatus Neomarinimicrobiota bacterium]|jgi:carbamate kinase|nr:carbamate kinase [Candidatus Neomarinimicrobiota bacterium]|tara:strand:+ start:427 stop:1371 length:945 start_codon:yes stop_codon:yes gene_type:complete